MAPHVRTTTSLLVCALLVPMSGCYEGLETLSDGDGAFGSEAGEDTTASGAASASGGAPGSGADTGEASATSGAGDDGGLDVTDGGGTEAGDPTGEETSNLASGIAITTVEMNQGVAITLVRDGAVVPAGSRNAAPIRGRAALVRGLWSLSSDFVPRRIEARLLLTSSSGQSQVFTHEREVSGPPDAAALEGGLLWEIPEGVIDAGTTFAVELREAGGAETHASSTVAGARVPTSDAAALSVASGEHALQIVIVPLRYNTGNQILTPSLSAADKTALEHAIYDQNPVENVEITYHAPVDYNAPVTTTEQFADILGFMSSLRSNEGAPPDVYYAALIDVGCFVVGCGNSGTAGIAYVTSAANNEAPLRVSANLWYDAPNSARTLVHEIGHNQGLNHVTCPGGGSVGDDPAFPHSGGQIGVWGYGPKSGTVSGTSAFDYMSYCGPVWASDWTWEKTRRRIESLSGAALVAEPTVDLLAGIVHDSGEATWFAVEGEPLSVGGRSASEQVVFFRDGNAIDTRAAVTGPISDLDAHWVLVEQPSVFDRAQWRDGSKVREIERSALDRFDRMRAMK